jgi:hypothetical protein
VGPHSRVHANSYRRRKVTHVLRENSSTYALRQLRYLRVRDSSLGEPGTGPSIIKRTLCKHDPKRLITPVVNRTLHTNHSTLRILCEAFKIDTEGRDCRCETRLIEEAQRLNHAETMLAPIIDDAHLLDIVALRLLRLALRTFPNTTTSS